MEIKRALEDSEHYLMSTYGRYPIVLVKGRGTKVWSSEGREYLDMVQGVATNVLGHCHPKVVVAIQKQAQRLIHVSNWFHIEPQIRLGKLLVENSFGKKAFICNSGTEAVEGSLKLARKYSSLKYGGTRYEIIAAVNSFHGRTLGSLSATGQEKMKAGFEPMIGGFSHVPYNDLLALEKAIKPTTCAIMLEPIQGEGGVRMPSPDFLQKVRDLCDRRDLLLILDEIQTGMGRTGKLFAHEHAGITPDIMALAKGLGGGIAIGAVVATDNVASAFKPGDHGSTFGGNPLACAAAIATMETILDSGLILDQCRRMGLYLTDKLLALKARHPRMVQEVRGLGLLMGVELTRESAPIARACLEKGLLINSTAVNVLRFMPPLTVQEGEIDQACAILDEVLTKLT